MSQSRHRSFNYLVRSLQGYALSGIAVILITGGVAGFVTTALATPTGQAKPASSSVVSGHARFTVITPTLVRLEYSPTGRFVDQRSYFAIHRHVVPPPFSVRHTGGKLIISTDSIEVIWGGDVKNESAGFTRTNLSIHFRDGNHWIVWTPASKQTGNLGGTLRSLDGCNGPEKLGNGLLSRDGWYLLKDHTFLLSNGKHPWVMPRPQNGELDWYFFAYGHNYHAALRDLTTVSGRVPIPPRYMLGSWHSRYWSFTGDQFRQLVLDYNEHHFPLDVMVMDMGWHITGHWGAYDWNRKLIPHPTQLLAWLHQQGLHVTLNIHPANGVGPWDHAFDAFCHAMGENPQSTKVIPFDCTSPTYMDSYFKLLLDPLKKQGVDFWWLDWQQGTKTAVPGVDPLPWLNALDFWNRARSGELRGASFSRWGGWGDQRYPIQFSGDTASRWRVLKFEVPFTADGGNVGAFYWSNDIGGHMKIIPDAELYTRWVQFGALSPVLRTHATRLLGDYRRPWLYGAQAEHASRAAFDLRSRLFPYIYTCAWLCWRDSVPLIRPAYFDHPRDEAAYLHPEEYFLGPDLLVAPIVKPGVGKAHLASTDVWFPKGTWWNLFNGSRVVGPVTTKVSASLNEIPVYGRGGTPIPMQKLTMRMAELPPDPLVICIYPGARGDFTFYEDDGVSPAYLHGDSATTKLDYHDLGQGTVAIDVGPTVGSYRGQPETRRVIIRLPITTVPVDVTVNGQAFPAARSGSTGWQYDVGALTTQITLPRASIRQAKHVVIHFSADNAVRKLLPQIVDRLALLNHALGEAGTIQQRWRFRLEEVHFQLITLKSISSQIFRPVGASQITNRLSTIDADITALREQLDGSSNQPARTVAEALSQTSLHP